MKRIHDDFIYNKIYKIYRTIFLGTDTLKKIESFNSGASNTKQIHFTFNIFYGIV
jgi:hypothetical protein